jgi:F0F1-type ATP synthase membrane subunit b/b'
MITLGQIIGVLVLLALVALIYFSFPPEPAENVEARKRHGKISKEELDAARRKSNLEVAQYEATKAH